MKEVNAVGSLQDHASARTLMLLVLIVLLACDPGMTVRQINSIVESENAAVTAIPKISIDVKTTHQMMGESRYDPQVIATNSSDVPVTITSVELVADGTTFQNKPRVPSYYPLKVPAHDTAALDVNFRFSDGVSKVFKNPSELRIHYSSQQGFGLARVTLVGGPLNAK